MKTKLTLRLDENLIAAAKNYSAKTGKPVSRIVSDLFKIIQNETQCGKDRLPPAAKSLKGALKETPVKEKDYKKYLEEKYS